MRCSVASLGFEPDRFDQVIEAHHFRFDVRRQLRRRAGIRVDALLLEAFLHFGLIKY